MKGGRMKRKENDEVSDHRTRCTTFVLEVAASDGEGRTGGRDGRTYGKEIRDNGLRSSRVSTPRCSAVRRLGLADIYMASGRGEGR